MAKITHISTQRQVQTKNGERKVYEVIVEGHQITLRRPLGKVVNVGDEIEYIKNDKGFYVEKSKKDKQDEFMEKLEKALLTIEDMLKRIKALEEFQQKNANALQELKKRAGNGGEVQSEKVEAEGELQSEKPRMEDIDLLKHDEELKNLNSYDKFKERAGGLKMSSLLFDKFYSRWLSFHTNEEDVLPF